MAGITMASNELGETAGEAISVGLRGGMTPMQALETATISPARHLGRKGRGGAPSCGGEACLSPIFVELKQGLENQHCAKFQA